MVEIISYGEQDSSVESWLHISVHFVVILVYKMASSVTLKFHQVFHMREGWNVLLEEIEGMSYNFLAVSSILMNEQYIKKVFLNRILHETRLCIGWKQCDQM